MLSAIFGRIRKYNVSRQMHRRLTGGEPLTQVRMTEYASLTYLDRIGRISSPGKNSYTKPKPMRNTWYVEDSDFDHTLLSSTITHPFMSSTPNLLESDDRYDGHFLNESRENLKVVPLELSTDSACCISACESSPSVTSLMRCTSIQNRSMKMTRKRHERVKRRRGDTSNSRESLSSTESVTDIDGGAEPKRKQPATNQLQDNTDGDQSQDDISHTDNTESNDVIEVNQSDSGISEPDSPTSIDENHHVIRASSINIKSWQIRRIRKQMQKTNKRLSASWEELVKQQDERET
jgi:hypothetical protein